MSGGNDYRLLAVEHQGDDVYDLAEQAARYRQVLVEALHALADRERQLKARDRTVDALREEVRAVRADREQRLAHARREYARLRDETRRLRAMSMTGDGERAAA